MKPVLRPKPIPAVTPDVTGQGPNNVRLWANGHPALEEWLDEFGHPHRLDGPAKITYRKDGSTSAETFCVEGLEHRSDGPARIEYDRAGNVTREAFRVNGRYHRIGGPSDIEYFEGGSIRTYRYQVEGEFHRVDGFAVLTYSGDGTPLFGNYRLEGRDYDDHEHFLDGLRELGEDRLVTEFENSSYAPLIAEGVKPFAIIDAVATGVKTVDGIREVLAGAPPEWVRSYESAES